MLELNISDEDIKNLSFEESFNYLEEIINKLENGNTKLEESINLYELGIKLKNHCEKKLKSSEIRIKKVLEDNSVEDFDENKKY